MPDITPKVKCFHQTLFWPLRLIPSEDIQNKIEKDGFVDIIKDILTQSMCWEEQNDLCGRGMNSDPATSYAEFVYFHPFIRRFLYGEQNENALHIYQRNDVKTIQITINKGKTFEFDVDRIHLYLFAIEVVMLVIEISSIESMELEDVEDLLNQFRHIYPPYWDNVKAGNSPKTVVLFNKYKHQLARSEYSNQQRYLSFVEKNQTDPIAEHWSFLLDPFVSYTSKQKKEIISYEQLGDARMPYMAYLAFDNPRLLTKGDMMRLGFAESSGDKNSLPYSSNSQFSQNFEQDYCYDPYWETSLQYYGKHNWMNMRYICCGYAFTMIGEFYKNENGICSFFNDSKIGALAHFRHHYFQIGLIVHFHKAGLLTLWDKLHKKFKSLNYLSSQLTPYEIQDVKQILQELQNLTKLFSEISTLGQAKELFNLWEYHLGIKDSLERALKETQDIHSRLEIEEQKQQTDTTIRLTVVATIGLAIALTLGVFGGSLQKIWGSDAPTLAALLIVLVVFVLGVLITLFLSQPLSSIIAKRGFSTYQWLKSKFEKN